MKKKILLCMIGSLVCWKALAQTNITDSILHQNYDRLFMVHFPPGFSTSTQRALVISLHGGSGNMINAQGFSLLNPVADQNDFVVAWPQGYGLAPPGFSWADGRNTSADQAGIDDVGFINKLTDTLIARYNIDTQRIYLCGFSNGGFMVQRMACETPLRFAAMASLGASMDTLLYQICSPSKPLPMAFFNGTADPAMPYGGGPMQNPQVKPVVPVDTAVQLWVTKNNCQSALPVFSFPDTFPADSSTAELYRFTNCDCNADVSFYKLINGGHTWPGVYVASQAAVLGNTNRDINASVELWNFFSAHPLCTTTTTIAENAARPALKLYPNPARNQLNLELDETGPFRISILNTMGQTVYTGINNKQIDIHNIASGWYYVRVETASSMLMQGLIINP
jgi:polyhydroxybutyrate depolymerase